MAELKIKADSGGGTVSFKGPATTTSNAAVQLTLPVDDGAANQYLKTDGSGALSWATVTGTTINNNADNRVITGSGTANTLEGEAKLTFNGTGDLSVTGTEGTSANFYLIADEGDDNGDGWRIGSNQDDNDLTFANNVSGSYVDKLTLFKDTGMKLVASSGEDCIIEMWADNAENNNDGWRINCEDNNSFNIHSYEDGAWERRLHVGAGDNGAVQMAWVNQNDISQGGISLANSAIATKFYATGDTTANVILFYNPGNGNVGKIQTNGSGTSFVTSSDYRLKENNVPLENAITKLKALKPYTFNFKKQPSEKIDGFYAHEADTVVPQAVRGDKDAMTTDHKGDTVIDPQGIDYGQFTPLLTKALQEAIAKIETLETKVAALEAG